MELNSTQNKRPLYDEVSVPDFNKFPKYGSFHEFKPPSIYSSNSITHEMFLDSDTAENNAAYYHMLSQSNTESSDAIHSFPAVSAQNSFASIQTLAYPNNSSALNSGSDASSDDEWDKMYCAFCNYIRTYKTLTIPLRLEFPAQDGSMCKLGLWLEDQCKLLFESKLLLHRYVKLQQLPYLLDAQYANQNIHQHPVNGIDISNSTPDNYLEQYNWNITQDVFGSNGNQQQFLINNSNIPETRSNYDNLNSRSNSIHNELIGAGNCENSPLVQNALSRVQSLAHNGISQCCASDQWLFYFEALKRFGDENCHCNVSYKQVYKLCTGEEVKLGRWVDKQRQKYRKSELRPERFALLDQLVLCGKFKWRLFEVTSNSNQMHSDSQLIAEDNIKWRASFELLLQFCCKFGHCNVPASYKIKLNSSNMVMVEYGKNTFRLGMWLMNQRKAKANGSLSPDREQLLQGLVNNSKLTWEFTAGTTVTSTTHDDGKWFTYYNALIQFGKDNGHCNVPQAKEVIVNAKVLKLGQWLNKQRKDHNNFTLLQSRTELLDKLVEEGKLKWNMLDK